MIRSASAIHCNILEYYWHLHLDTTETEPLKTSKRFRISKKLFSVLVSALAVCSFFKRPPHTTLTKVKFHACDNTFINNYPIARLSIILTFKVCLRSNLMAIWVFNVLGEQEPINYQRKSANRETKTTRTSERDPLAFFSTTRTREPWSYWQKRDAQTPKTTSLAIKKTNKKHLSTTHREYSNGNNRSKNLHNNHSTTHWPCGCKGE